MKTNSGFFDSVEGDKVYGAADFTNVLSDIVTDGVSTRVSNGLEVRGSNSGFHVTPGRAYVEGHWFELIEATDLAVSTSGSDREVYVAVVEESKELMLETYESGNPPSTPYLNLARGIVRANASSVASGDIEDLRIYTEISRLVQNQTEYSFVKTQHMKIARLLQDAVMDDWDGVSGHITITMQPQLSGAIVSSGTWRKPTIVFATGNGKAGNISVPVHLAFTSIKENGTSPGGIRYYAIKLYVRAFTEAQLDSVHAGVLIIQFG